MTRSWRRALLSLALLLLLSCKRKPLDDSLASVARTPGLELPTSALGAAPKPEGEEPAKIVITKDAVTIALDRHPITTLPWDPNLGLSADVKARGSATSSWGSSPNPYFITPLAHALGGTAQAKRCPWKSRFDIQEWEGVGPCAVVIVADSKTPYRVIAEVAYTARVQRFTSIALAVRSNADGAPAAVELATGTVPCERMRDPATGRCRMGASDAPSLASVTISKGGFTLDVEGRGVALGCQGPGHGVTIPLAGGQLDHASLSTCLKRVHESSAELSQETTAWLAASAEVPLSDLIATIDTMRGAPGAAALYSSVGLLLPAEERMTE